MRLAQAIALFCVLALPAAEAQLQRGVVAVDSVAGLNVPSAQTTPRKVFIVQLKTPSAVEQHAQVYGSNAASFGAALRSAPRFSKDSAAVQSYTRRLVSEQNRAIARVGAGVEKIYTYQYSLNGFAARMSDVEAAKMRHLPEVLHVWEDEVRPLVTDDSPNFLNLFNRESGLRGPEGLDGEDVVIGVIDSGIVPNHPSLDDSREAGPRICRGSFGQATFLGLWLCSSSSDDERELLFEPPLDWNGECQAGDGFTEEDCNNKLIGARYFVDGARASGPIEQGEFFSPRDVDGHGTHTATTAAGNRTDASAFGTLLGTIQGIAPRARVAAYKACWLRPGAQRARCATPPILRSPSTRP